jgi:hypothetical protein
MYRVVRVSQLLCHFSNHVDRAGQPRDALSDAHRALTPSVTRPTLLPPRSLLHPQKKWCASLTLTQDEPALADRDPQARNEEKAQSMLYRFREAQAAELGLGTRTDRRPRMASACKSLRECERWRGEILREVSRKVSKIQDCAPPLLSAVLRVGVCARKDGRG